MTLFISLALIFAFWAALIFYKYKTIEKDAVEIFNARKLNEAPIAKLGETAFVEAYKRANSVRGQILNFVGALAAVICLPTFFFIATWLWNNVWNISGRMEDLDEGHAPWLFGVSILCVLGIVGIAAITARLHHHNRPKSLDEEIQIQTQGQQ